MIELIRDISLIKINHYQRKLEEAGILTFIRNENVAVTEISIPVFYPALCIMNDEDKEKALGVLKKSIEEENTPISQPDHICPQCNAKNPGNFELCWSCSAEFKG